MREVTLDARGALIVFAMVVVTFGVANLAARKYSDHPAASAWLDLFG